MKNINFKSIKDLSTKLFYNSLYENNEFSYKDFIKDVKSSPALRTQYLVYTNIENNKFDDRETAAYFLKDNFDLFKQFSKKEITEANKVIADKYFSQIDLNEDTDVIYDLITESTKDKASVNHKKKAQLFNAILTDLVTKDVITEDTESAGGLEFNKNIPIKKVIKRASEIINEKYSFFNDTEKDILKAFINKDTEAQENIYKSLINENLNLLKRKLVESNEDEEVYEKLQLTEEKLNSLKYTSNISEFNKLLELKKSLL